MIIRPLGRERVLGFFENAVASGSLGHAYIIEGEAGSGKRTVSRYLAALALCENGTLCGECASCREVCAQTNPDLTVITAEGKATIGVDKIRQAVTAVSYKPVHGGRRVYIFEDAHLITAQGQNALLKVIEEPPEGALFLLLCERKAQLLRTIISRAQVLKMQPLGKDELKKIVPEAADFELTYCNGNPGKLKKICSDAEFKEFRDGAVEAVLRLFTGGAAGLYDAADFFEQNKERKDDLFAVTLYVLRDVMFKKKLLKGYIVNSDKEDVLNRISAAMSPKACMQAAEAVLEAERDMGKYANFTLAVQAMLIRCKNTIE